LRELKITRVVIAHRPETIRAADRVFSLDKARRGATVARASILPAAAAAHPAMEVQCIETRTRSRM
jgi:ABC-type bacteriocin/lantibiotic exporter with double-glycine peptidase domain